MIMSCGLFVSVSEVQRLFCILRSTREFRPLTGKSVILLLYILRFLIADKPAGSAVKRLPEASRVPNTAGFESVIEVSLFCEQYNVSSTVRPVIFNADKLQLPQFKNFRPGK